MESHLLDAYMRRCFDLARFGKGKTSPNPTVGSIVVHDHRIIGEGYHKSFGQAHAEDVAIHHVLEHHSDLLKESTIFISLEPCFHHGHTPPCVDLILKHKIPRVVISCIDPDPRVAGKSIKKLKDQGIEVITDILVGEGQNLIKHFATRIYKKRPYITLKVALDKNGNIGSVGKSIWMSNSLSKIYVHRIRAFTDAIMVGANTVHVDNPLLNNRLFYGNSPLKVLFDRDLTIPLNSNLFSTAPPTLVYTNKSFDTSKYSLIKYIQIDDNQSHITQIVSDLHHRGVNHLMVEGGSKLLNTFIEEAYWDEVILIKTNREITDQPIPFPPFDGMMIDAFSLGNNRVERWINQ